jgi:hypothetical protein
LVKTIEDKKYVYCFDIDDTICMTIGTNYKDAKPIKQRIVRINTLFREGHIIKLFTARGSESGIDWREITEIQLTDWGLNYTELIFGKPAADFYIDDKAINEGDFNWD